MNFTTKLTTLLAAVGISATMIAAAATVPTPVDTTHTTINLNQASQLLQA